MGLKRFELESMLLPFLHFSGTGLIEILDGKGVWFHKRYKGETSCAGARQEASAGEEDEEEEEESEQLRRTRKGQYNNTGE